MIRPHRAGMLCLLALGLVLVAGATAAKERYNPWAKEKIRYHRDRVYASPYNAQLRVLLASAYYEDGHLFEAARQLEKAVELEADYPEAHCNLGIVRHAQRMVQDAEAHYREALRQDSTLVDAMAGLGTLLCANGRRGEGIEFLEATLRTAPRRDDARFNLGVAYHKVGDYRRALEHLDILYERVPGYAGVRLGLAQACFGRGLTLLQAKQPEEARGFLERAVTLETGEADLFYALGLAHLALEDLAAAETGFRRAVTLEEDHVPALQNLATVLERRGHSAEAQAVFAEVARLTPHLDTIDAARDATYDETVFFVE